ncbi:ferritin family protein [Candidatus Venteria ishoeyi]|uniref:ferritin family protein n=1 Tax=Candidatus Venteria ishoeyi TaxID=1899563 RepID=UPI0025A5898D|nr:ferritin family protein [Candidatus Venteria ishoeyi]MDM8547751.1 ferritin family protein [Candidatus Venteria ishoeyi]
MSDINPEGSGYEQLKARQTLAEVLETVLSFEQTAYAFYSALTEKVSKRLRPLVKELAEEEQQHCLLFEDLKNNPAVRAVIAQRIKTPENDHKFSDYIHMPELDENPDDQSILQYAIGREHAAMEQYDGLAQESPNAVLKDTFTWLAQEELAHKKELEKRYYQLVYLSHE